MNEKENTMRILKELPELQTSLWCKIGVHKWTKWGEPIRSSASIYILQERMCSSCNAYSTRKRVGI